MQNEPSTAPGELSEEERETIRTRLFGLSDTDLVATLLVNHKRIERGSSGHVHNLAERGSTVIAVVLDRFAPEAFGEAVDIIFPEERPDLHLVGGKDPA